MRKVKKKKKKKEKKKKKRRRRRKEKEKALCGQELVCFVFGSLRSSLTPNKKN